MMCFYEILRRFPTVQKFLFLLFFRSVRLGLRVQSLHFIQFLGRDLRQVPDEQNQVPSFGVAPDTVLFTEGGHPAQADAVFNRVVQLTIALVLRLSRAHVRRSWIEALTKECVPTTVVRMACG